MTLSSNFGSLAVGVLLVACATEPAPPQHTEGPGYWDLPSSHRMPTSEEERRIECGRIRQEVARLQSAVDAAETFLHPEEAAVVRVQVRRSLADLQTRAADVGCGAAYSQSPPAKGMSFDDCFKKCKQYTSRTDAECFDSCRK